MSDTGPLKLAEQAIPSTMNITNNEDHIGRVIPP
jgi:hypothetical protein